MSIHRFRLKKKKKKKKKKNYNKNKQIICAKVAYEQTFNRVMLAFDLYQIECSIYLSLGISYILTKDLDVREMHRIITYKSGN